MVFAVGMLAQVAYAAETVPIHELDYTGVIVYNSKSKVVDVGGLVFADPSLVI